MRRVEAWPESAQNELAEVVHEIDAAPAGGVYHATAEELRAVDKALADVERRGVASGQEVEAVFAKFRPK